MKRKPSRTFIYLAVVMVILMVVGLVMVGILAVQNRRLSPFELTRDYISSINIIDGNMLGTVTYQAGQTQTANMTLTPAATATS